MLHSRRKIELSNRFENFKSEWFDYWYENHTLIDGHVLRGALRILDTDQQVKLEVTIDFIKSDQ